MTIDKLKTHLWNCADILRGSAVDRTHWKGYILPLLFFKRICDAYDEETAEATELFGDVDPVDFPEVHRFTIPEGAHWRNVRESPANVGAALSHAMREIELACYLIFSRLSNCHVLSKNGSKGPKNLKYTIK